MPSVQPVQTQPAPKPRKNARTTIAKSVLFTPEAWQQAKTLGHGNAAAGIRRALAEAAKNNFEK